MSKSKITKYICIACPVGCHLELEEFEDKSKEIEIRGNLCRRGITYGLEEHTEPKRIVTVTCAINSKIVNRIPVKTDKTLKKDLIDQLIEELYTINLQIPVKTGDIIIENFKDSGVNVVATRTIIK